MIIQHNMISNFTQRELKIIGGEKTKSTEKLSSGYRINRSADDAAGLSISEKLRFQIRGLNRASDNISDGVSFVKVGEGALNEVHALLQRVRELAIQASNDTYTEDERKMIDDEVQNIKKETKKIFNDTQFNEKYIFRAPYTPDVEGQPDDFRLFNIGYNGTTDGGVLINNKRYTWGELGVSQSSSDWSTEISDPENSGELIRLRLDANMPVEKIMREYELSANSSGIFVNDVPAGKWDPSTGGAWADVATIDRNGDTISFEYRGMKITIEGEPGDTEKDFIDHLNTGLDVITWDAIPAGKEFDFAATSTADKMTLNVTNATKNSIEGFSYRVVADDEGVMLEQTGEGTDGLSHKKIGWAELKNTDSGEPVYPIADWGVADENANPVTIDSEATYRYTDNPSSGYPDVLSFNFSAVLDEVSKQEFGRALTQNLTGGSVNAPTGSAATGSANITCTGYSGINFHYQRDVFNRDFDNGTAISAILKREAVDEGNITDADSGITYNLIRYDYNLYTSAYNTPGNEAMSGSGSICVDTDQGVTDPADGKTYIEINGTKYLTRENPETVTLYDKTGKNNLAYMRFRYMNPVGTDPDADNSTTVSISTPEKATRTFSKTEKTAGVSSHTLFDYRVNVPEKLLHIQSGSRGWQSIDIRWPALTNTIIGIGSTNTRSYGNAQAAIRQTDDAISMISKVRTIFGVAQNRLEYAYKIDQNTAENSQAGESRIRDTDMAKEMVNYSKHNIIEQAGQNMLAQANQSTQGVMSLLG